MVKLNETTYLNLDINDIFKRLHQNCTRKYIERNEGDGIQYSAIEERF